MGLILYATDYSPTVRSVLIAAKILGLELHLKKINMFKKEHNRPDYTEINPTNGVPTLLDNETKVYTSHAINLYLIEKYAKNETLYPTNPTERVIINDLLFYEAGTFFPILRTIVRGKFLNQIETITGDLIENILQVYGCLEKVLGDKKWMAGPHLTLADVTLLPTVTSSNVFVPINEKQFPKLKDWMERAQNLPEFDGDKAGLEAFKNVVKKLFPLL